MPLLVRSEGFCLSKADKFSDLRLNSNLASYWRNGKEVPRNYFDCNPYIRGPIEHIRTGLDQVDNGSLLHTFLYSGYLSSPGYMLTNSISKILKDS